MQGQVAVDYKRECAWTEKERMDRETERGNEERGAGMKKGYRWQ